MRCSRLLRFRNTAEIGAELPSSITQDEPEVFTWLWQSSGSPFSACQSAIPLSKMPVVPSRKVRDYFMLMLLELFPRRCFILHVPPWFLQHEEMKCAQAGSCEFGG